MREYLFNPFKKIAGTRALLFGGIIILTTSVVAWFSHCHFDGAIDAHVGSPGPWAVYLMEGIISWAVLVVVFYSAGRLLSKSAVRWIDIAGTIALARYPYFFLAVAAFFSPDVDMELLANPAELPAGQLWSLIVFSLVFLVFVVWFVALLYRAFTVSANLKGSRTVWGFIAALIVAEVLGGFVFSFMYSQF